MMTIKTSVLTIKQLHGNKNPSTKANTSTKIHIRDINHFNAKLILHLDTRYSKMDINMNMYTFNTINVFHIVD